MNYIHIKLTATDIDSEYFTYGLVQSPEGMSITSDGLIEWIPTEGIYSSDIVIASVSDNHPTNPITSYQQFLIVVTPVNDAPIITSIADTIATVGELYTYNVEVYDPDDDQFLYILFNEPEGMNISDSGEITWVPNIPGDYTNITIAVSDGGEDNIQPVEEIFIVVVEAASPLITMDFELLHEANLISFMGIPQDSTVSSIFEPLIGNAQSLIGQSIASSYNETLGWIGALTTVSPTMGYWLKLNHPPVESFIVEAYPTNPHQVYNLKEGANIISYVGIDEMPVGDAIPDQYEERFMQDAICESCGIIGESEATILHPSLGWLGSLNTLYNLNGYWVIVDEDLDFNWHIPEDQELIRQTSISSFVKRPVPFEFQYAQSTQQAFYFVEEISIDDNELNTDDWLIAYSNNTVVGAKQWSGLFTDIPVMGMDGYDDTFGYIETGMTQNSSSIENQLVS